MKYYIPFSDNVFFLIKGGIGFSNSTGKISGYTDVTSDDSFGNTTTFRSTEYGPNKTKTSEVNIGISPGIL